MSSIKQISKGVSTDIQSLSSISLLVEAVRCLLTNSLEAGSTQINIYIDWPSLSIQLIDNGSGIAPEGMDKVARKGFSSRSVSTDNSKESFIHTGSTLYALAQISFLSIISNGLIKKNSDLARVVTLEDFTHAKFPYFGPHNYNSGLLPLDNNFMPSTCVTATGLFHRFPVRRILEQRLGRSTVEKLLQDIVFYMAGGKGVAIGMWIDGKILAKVSRNASLDKRYRQIFGVDLSFTHKTVTLKRYKGDIFVSTTKSPSFASSMKRCIFLDGMIQPKSYLASPLSSTFLSERVVLILVKTNRLDQTIGFDFDSLSVANEVVDTKSSVNISNLISQLLLNIECESPSRQPKRSSAKDFGTLPTKKGRRSPKIPKRTPKLTPESSNLVSTVTETSEISKFDLSNCRVVAQLGHKFILLATLHKPIKLIAVDQHACDERIQVEQLISEFTNNLVSARLAIKLHIPFIFSVSLSELVRLAAVAQHFLIWGISCEVATSNVTVLTLPEILLEKTSSLKHALLTYAEDLLSSRKRPISESYLKFESDSSRSASTKLSHSNPHSERPLWSCILPHVPQVILDQLNTKACHSLLVFGTRLDHHEMSYLISSLNKCVMPLQCAHGRPSAVPLMTSMQDESGI